MVLYVCEDYSHTYKGGCALGKKQIIKTLGSH